MASLDDQIRRIKLLAMDFDGVLTSNTVYIDEDGRELVRCWRGDGIGLNRLRELGIGALILSAEPSRIVQVRAQKLGVLAFYGLDDKMDMLERIVEVRELSLEQVAYIGNDINDLECLASVGLPFAVADAHPKVLKMVPRMQWTTAKGGMGAVREVCDWFEGVLCV